MKSLPSITPGLRNVLGVAAACGLIGLGCGSAAAAPAPIYKCFDRNLAIVYTDLPCKGGEQLDLRPGEADPAAVARLDREREALDRSSAQRVTDMRRAALERSQYVLPPDYAPNYAPNYAPYYDGYGYADLAGYFPYGYGAFAGVPQYRHRPPEARFDRRGMRKSVVPTRPSPLLR
jgi:hypothetical protein